jgi:hypothetical protein
MVPLSDIIHVAVEAMVQDSLESCVTSGSSRLTVFSIQYWCWLKTWSAEFCLCMYVLFDDLPWVFVLFDDQSLAAWILEINCLILRMDCFAGYFEYQVCSFVVC